MKQWLLKLFGFLPNEVPQESVKSEEPVKTEPPKKPRKPRASKKKVESTTATAQSSCVSVDWNLAANVYSSSPASETTGSCQSSCGSCGCNGD